MMNQKYVELKGKIIITGSLKAITGLHIGGASSGLEIGGLDNLVLREKVTGRPYIPGSSIKGKMRSLLTKALGMPINTIIKGDRDKSEIRIHWCRTSEEYSQCTICPLFGEFASGPGNERYDFVQPTRLIIRDGTLLEEIEITDENGNMLRRRWKDIDTDLPYTEVKWEAIIDVITASATPRQIERVPAGSLFDIEMLCSVYDDHDSECLRDLILGMQLLEDDYLGGSGSRGYGKVKFDNIRLVWKPIGHYKDPTSVKALEINNGWSTPEELLKNIDAIFQNVWPKTNSVNKQ